MYRGAYISEKLKEVKNEQLYSGNGFLVNDYVDIYTVKDGKCNVCYKCFGSFPKSDVKCPHCGINMEKYKNDCDPYFWTESKHPIMSHEKECNSNLPVKSRFMPLHKDLLLLPGPGHMELNEARILLKLLWHPLISQLASMLGFRTPRAKDVVREGIDHHRTRQILSVCLEALSKELVLPVVRECIRNEEEVSVEGYQKYFKNVQNQSYIFFYDIAFSYLLSFHLLTEAIRKNNSHNSCSKNSIHTFIL